MKINNPINSCIFIKLHCNLLQKIFNLKNCY